MKPLFDRVVVQPIDAEETTAGGIVLPDQAREKPNKGLITAVGPECVAVEAGQTVIYSKYAGTDLQGVKLIAERDILAIVE